MASPGKRREMDLMKLYVCPALRAVRGLRGDGSGVGRRRPVPHVPTQTGVDTVVSTVSLDVLVVVGHVRAVTCASRDAHIRC